MCEVLQKEQRFFPPTFFLFAPPLVQALPASLVCGNSTEFSTLQQYVEHMMEIHPGIQPPWEVRSYSQ